MIMFVAAPLHQVEMHISFWLDPEKLGPRHLPAGSTHRFLQSINQIDCFTHSITIDANSLSAEIEQWKVALCYELQNASCTSGGLRSLQNKHHVRLDQIFFYIAWQYYHDNTDEMQTSSPYLCDLRLSNSPRKAYLRGIARKAIPWRDFCWV